MVGLLVYYYLIRIVNKIWFIWVNVKYARTNGKVRKDKAFYYP